MSHTEKYLVTSATGNTGYQVALQLLANGRNVRVMSRTEKASIQQLKKRGAEVTLGSIDNRHNMQEALSGVQRVYYCRPIIPGLLASIKMFAELAQQEKIESVVNLSQYLAELDSHPSKQTNEHKQSYQVLSDANIGASHLIPGWFADNVFGTALFITQRGRLPFPLGNGRCPVVANEDIAAVAVSLLQDPAGHEGKRYQPTGPRSLTMNDMMESFGRVLGRKVKAMPMPMFLFHKAIIQMGYRPFLLSQLILYVNDFQNNVFDYGPTDVVSKFTGRNAEDFDVTARRYCEEGDLMTQTFSGRMHAMKQFMQIGFTKAPSNKELARLNQ
ncbi:NmrA family NAD(P)-binding protein [Pirellulales bacterium]|nr:NmrA family NAD(P)-binding protein [Pirellulales bacterium]